MKNPKFQIYKDKAGEFRFRLKAGNGEVILTGEGYTTKAACQNGIESVKKNAPNEDRFERKTSKNGQSYFVLKAANAQVIGNSEFYTNTSGCHKGIQAVQRVAPDAPIEDTTV